MTPSLCPRGRPPAPLTCPLAGAVGLCLALPAAASAALNLTGPEDPPRASAVLAVRPQAIDAAGLFAAFERDRAAARRRFAGRRLEVSGVVARVGRDDAGQHYLVFAAGRAADAAGSSASSPRPCETRSPASGPGRGRGSAGSARGARATST